MSAPTTRVPSEWAPKRRVCSAVAFTAVAIGAVVGVYSRIARPQPAGIVSSDMSTLWGWSVSPSRDSLRAPGSNATVSSTAPPEAATELPPSAAPTHAPTARPSPLSTATPSRTAPLSSTPTPDATASPRDAPMELNAATVLNGLTFFSIGDWGRGGCCGQAETGQLLGDWVARYLPPSPAPAPASAAGGTQLDAPVDAPGTQTPPLEAPTPWVISTGDNFYSFGVTSAADPQFDSSWRSVYTHAALREVPWYAVAGNHDYRGSLVPGQSQVAWRGDARWRMPALNYTLVVQLPGSAAVPATSSTGDGRKSGDRSAATAGGTASAEFVTEVPQRRGVRGQTVHAPGPVEPYSVEAADASQVRDGGASSVLRRRSVVANGEVGSCLYMSE